MVLREVIGHGSLELGSRNFQERCHFSKLGYVAVLLKVPGTSKVRGLWVCWTSFTAGISCRSGAPTAVTRETDGMLVINWMVTGLCSLTALIQVVPIVRAFPGGSDTAQAGY